MALWTGKFYSTIYNSNEGVGAGDVDHAYLVGSYLHYSEKFETIQAKDLSKRKKKEIVGDPLYVVTAEKKIRTRIFV